MSVRLLRSLRHRKTLTLWIHSGLIAVHFYRQIAKSLRIAAKMKTL